MENKNQIYVIRHGETIWNKSHLLQGQKDIPLSQTGLEQARNMALHFIKVPLAFIGTSPLMRTQQTASIISDHLKIPCHIFHELKARSYGPWEGKNIATIHEEHKDLFSQMKSWDLNQIYMKAPLDSIESYQVVSERALNLLKTLVQKFPGKQKLLITHSGVMTSILLALKFQTKEIPIIDHHGHIKISFSDDEFKIENIVGLIEPKREKFHNLDNERIFMF